MSRVDSWLAALAALALTSCSVLERDAASPGDRPRPEMGFSILGGAAGFDNVLGEFDSPMVLGAELFTDRAAGSFGWEAGVLRTGEDGAEGEIASVRTLELYTGARRSVDFGRFTMHAGAGLSYLLLSTDTVPSPSGSGPPIDFVGASPDDDSLGGYLQVGLRARLTEAVDAGIWARVRDGHSFNLSTSPSSLDARSTALGLSLALRY